MHVLSSRMIFWIVLSLASIKQCESTEGLEFLPSISAQCSAGVMNITVMTRYPFLGVIHARGKRIPGCYVFGSGEKSTSLQINLQETEQSKIQCGVSFNSATEEKSIAIAVRIHRTLELADDKFYIITCGKASDFRNNRNETSQVSLQMMEDGRPIKTVIYGQMYRLRTQIIKHDRSMGMHISSCYGFSGNNSTLLIDRFGCPFPRYNSVMSQFHYDFISGLAEAIIYQMFKFPNSNQLHIQCDVGLCQENCPKMECEQPHYEGKPIPGLLTASTTVFVVEPGETRISEASSILDCGSGNSWLIPTSVILGILFLIMVIVNIFLCSAVTSVCSVRRRPKKRVLYGDQFDPYRITWQETPFDSRYSMRTTEHCGSGPSTITSSKSSEQYDLVQSRPESRYCRQDSIKGYIIEHHDSFSKSSSKI